MKELFHKISSKLKKNLSHGILTVTVIFTIGSMMWPYEMSMYEYASYYYNLGYYDYYASYYYEQGYYDSSFENSTIKQPSKAVHVSDTILQRYVGNFVLQEDPKQGFYTVINNGRFFIIGRTRKPIEIFPSSKTTFFEHPDFESSYEFSLNPLTDKYDLTITYASVVVKAERTD